MNLVKQANIYASLKIALRRHFNVDRVPKLGTPEYRTASRNEKQCAWATASLACQGLFRLSHFKGELIDELSEQVQRSDADAWDYEKIEKDSVALAKQVQTALTAEANEAGKRCDDLALAMIEAKKKQLRDTALSVDGLMQAMAHMQNESTNQSALIDSYRQKRLANGEAEQESGLVTWAAKLLAEHRKRGAKDASRWEDVKAQKANAIALLFSPALLLLERQMEIDGGLLVVPRVPLPWGGTLAVCQPWDEMEKLSAWVQDNPREPNRTAAVEALGGLRAGAICLDAKRQWGQLLDMDSGDGKVVAKARKGYSELNDMSRRWLGRH